MEGSKMDQAVAYLLRATLKLMVSMGTLAKQDAFAYELGWTPDQLKQRLSGRTSLAIEELWVIREVLERLDEEALDFFDERLLGTRRRK